MFIFAPEHNFTRVIDDCIRWNSRFGFLSPFQSIASSVLTLFAITAARFTSAGVGGAIFIALKGTAQDCEAEIFYATELFFMRQPRKFCSFHALNAYFPLTWYITSRARTFVYILL